MSSSERLVVVGGLGLAAASFVPWYRPDEFSFGLDDTRTNGWQAPDATLSVVATIVGVGLAVAVLAAGRGVKRPAAGNVSWGTLLTGASAAVFGLVALKYSLNTEHTTVGIYLALVAAVTQLYGAYVTKVEEPAPDVVAAGGPRSEVPATADPSWPETSYFLAAWLRPNADPATAVAAYRLAFAGEPARQDRLAAELRLLLDPSRPEVERTALVAAFAPYVRPGDASVVLLQLTRALEQPLR